MKKSFWTSLVLGMSAFCIEQVARAEFGAPQMLRLSCEREAQASGPVVVKSRRGEALEQFAASLTLMITPEGMATDAALVSQDLGECVAHPHFGARGPSFIPSHFRLSGYKCRAGQVDVSVWEHPIHRQPAGAVLQIGQEYWACRAQ